MKNNLQNYLLMVLSTIFVSDALAELDINDPTRPVYMEKAVSSHAGNISPEDLQEKTTIPELTQLVFAKSRKVAIFGDIIVQIGETAPFGEIIDIQKDRVFVKTDNLVQEIVFYDQLDNMAEKSSNEELIIN